MAVVTSRGAIEASTFYLTLGKRDFWRLVDMR